MTFELGQAIGNYEIADVVDTGVSGVTYRVRNTLAGRIEILKVLPRELQEDRERVQRFLREAKIHARLSHPNIASFYNAVEIEGKLVMTMELVEGVTLEEECLRGPVAWQKAVDYAGQALAALEYAHANGVVHRNLSPSSLVITSGGVVKITDFGLAKAVTDPRLTLTGMVIGPMHYLAPEQVKGIPDLDARTDIYSLAMVLYEAVTGKKAFDSKSQFEVMEAHVARMPQRPSEVLPGLPPELDEVILTAAAKEPEQRFQSAREFRAALERIQPGPAEQQEETASLPLAAETHSSPGSGTPVEETPASLPPLGHITDDEQPAAPPAASLARPEPKRWPKAAALPRPVSRRAAPTPPPADSESPHPFWIGAAAFALTMLLLLTFLAFANS